jgi:hypothetical protein
MHKLTRSEEAHRHLRHELTLFGSYLRQLRLDKTVFSSEPRAVHALAKVMMQAFKQGLAPGVVSGIRHGATTLFAIVYGHDFSRHPRLSGLARSFCNIRPARAPVTEVSWHPSQLLDYFVRCGSNTHLLYIDLVGKFVCLCIMLVGMRMAEINRIDPWSSEPGDVFWQFYVKIKKHAELAPIRLHRVPTIPEIDPVLTLLEIRSRGVDPRGVPASGRLSLSYAPDVGARGLGAGRIPAKCIGPCSAPEVGALGVDSNLVVRPRQASFDPAARSTGIQRISLSARPGLLDENGTHYKNEQIRALAKRILIRANIPETRPYHIKHAMVSLLYSKKLPPEQIALFLRQKVDSFTFFKSYVSNDLGRLCSSAIVTEFKVSCLVFYFCLKKKKNWVFCFYFCTAVL